MTFLVDVHHIGDHQTGNETVARNISRELRSLADPGELVFAAGKDGRSDVAALTDSDPQVVSASSIRRLAFDLPRLARRVDAAAVLVQYTKPVTRRPCVVMVHDLSAFDPRSSTWLNWRFRSRVRASISHSARNASILIACSQFTRTGLLERFSLDPRRVVLAPSALDPGLATLLDSAARTERPTKAVRVISVGNVVPRKNLLVVGAAIAELRRRGVAVEYRVVGGVPANGVPIANELHAMLGDAASFTGYVSPEELASEYAQADVFAFPSLFEGFGIPAVEAMYAGVPVVTSDAGSLPEAVGNAGVVVPATDQSAWAAALGKLIENAELRAEYVRLGRKQAHATSWADSAAVVLDALRQAAGH